jgi:hypothetical protein
VNDDKRKACLLVLVLLRTPLMLMSRGSREDAIIAARAHGVTAEDLLNVAVEMEKNA